MLVSPLVHVSQKQPFEEDNHSHIERSPEASGMAVCLRSASQGLRSASQGSGGIEVELNIYDVTHGSVIHSINEFFAHSMSPLKLGGLFHVGIKIMNVEWTYGQTKSGTGVAPGRPQSELQHRFRETVQLANTKLSEREVGEVVRSLIQEYRGRDYNLIERNCCHFVEDFCQRLGVGSIPAWVHRLGRAYDGLQKASKSLGSLSAGPSLSCCSVGSGESSGRQDKCKRRSNSMRRGRNAFKEIICM